MDELEKTRLAQDGVIRCILGTAAAECVEATK
jgi:hypothetical protein